MKINTIITAGGTSQRYGVKNKLFERCGTSIVLIEAIKPFLKLEEITKIIVGIETSFADEFSNALALAGLGDDRRITMSVGGKSRTQTVKNALVALDSDADFVLVHDGARPYVTETLINAVIDCAVTHGVALPLLPMTDAVADISDGVSPVDRKNLRRVQTPFCARKEILEKAYEVTDKPLYDDLSAVKPHFSGKIGFVDGDVNNIKITYEGDIKQGAECPYLTGCGYDIHRLTDGDGIKLMGVKIPCEYAFIAHSDGDVPVHAIMDAILSAIGEKDIGHLFPVDDARYDNAESLDLLREVLRIAVKKRYSVHNVTVSIIAERPMLAPYIDAMRTGIADVLSIEPDRVGISATTNEKVGDIGDGKAIAAYASVLLSKTY